MIKIDIDNEINSFAVEGSHLDVMSELIAVCGTIISSITEKEGPIFRDVVTKSFCETVMETLKSH